MPTKSPDAEWIDVHLINYVNAATRSRDWFEAADELQIAVDLLKPQVERWWVDLIAWHKQKRGEDPPDEAVKFPSNGCHSITMMLMAFVVENLGGGSFRSVEGNTSFDNAGSQSNGGCVAVRTRSIRDVGAIARPAY